MKKKISNLHIETTTKCNLACPQCPRTWGDEENPLLIHGNAKVDDYIFLQEYDIEAAYLCGNFGDALSNNNSVDILNWLRVNNPDIRLSISTNGSLRNKEYWKDLARTVLTSPYDYITFAIDGLEDTNHIYRRGSSWKKIMENAQTYIDNGGRAHWDYLIFEHNKHQVEEAKELAKKMGFERFSTKITKRRVHKSVSWLTKVEDIEITHENVKEVQCDHLDNNSYYLNSRGIMSPCCFVGGAREMKKDYPILETDEEIVQMVRDGNPHRICKESCGKVNGTTSSKNQYRQVFDLKL